MWEELKEEKNITLSMYVPNIEMIKIVHSNMFHRYCTLKCWVTVCINCHDEGNISICYVPHGAVNSSHPSAFEMFNFLFLYSKMKTWSPLITFLLNSCWLFNPKRFPGLLQRSIPSVQSMSPAWYFVWLMKEHSRMMGTISVLSNCFCHILGWKARSSFTDSNYGS